MYPLYKCETYGVNPVSNRTLIMPITKETSTYNDEIIKAKISFLSLENRDHFFDKNNGTIDRNITSITGRRFIPFSTHSYATK